MHVRRVQPFADQRLVRAGVHGHVTPEQLDGGERVAGRVLERDVAAHGRHADEIAPVRGGRDRDDVVVAGIAVEQHGHEHHASLADSTTALGLAQPTSSSDTTSTPAARNAAAVTPAPARRVRVNVPS